MLTTLLLRIIFFFLLIMTFNHFIVFFYAVMHTGTVMSLKNVTVAAQHLKNENE